MATPMENSWFPNVARVMKERDALKRVLNGMAAWSCLACNGTFYTALKAKPKFCPYGTEEGCPDLMRTPASAKGGGKA